MVKTEWKHLKHYCRRHLSKRFYLVPGLSRGKQILKITVPKTTCASTGKNILSGKTALSNEEIFIQDGHDYTRYSCLWIFLARERKNRKTKKSNKKYESVPRVMLNVSQYRHRYCMYMYVQCFCKTDNRDKKSCLESESILSVNSCWKYSAYHRSKWHHKGEKKEFYRNLEDYENFFTDWTKVAAA